jgi:hypothetical protein
MTALLVIGLVGCFTQNSIQHVEIAGHLDEGIAVYCDSHSIFETTECSDEMNGLCPFGMYIVSRNVRGERYRYVIVCENGRVPKG